MHEDQCWQAVLARDLQADGVFVYAVRSTGIYCRPSCPSRRPQRAQVSFFEHANAAESAGYRPCRRCVPQESVAPSSNLVQQVCSYIEAHLDEALTLQRLSEEIHMSQYHLQRVFKQKMGITPRQYVDACRVKQFKTLLRSGAPVTGALYDVGFSSSSRLYERVPDQLGMAPTTYRRGGSGMHITYTLVDSPSGRLLVGATERGICAVYLGDSDEELVEMLTHEYPGAEIRPGERDLAQWVEVLLNYLEGREESPHLDLPLDIQATAFQWRVWQALQAIPYGQTRSYGEIAQELGDSRKARAVANACASNSVALLIPCHRVVRGDGVTGGYRWGSARKQRLLALEREAAAIVDGTSSHR